MPRKAPYAVEKAPRETGESSGVLPALEWHLVVSAMLDQLDEPAVLVGPRAVVRLVNGAFAATVGCAAEELRDCAWSELFENDADELLALAGRAGARVVLRTGTRVAHRLALHAKLVRVGRERSETLIVQVEKVERLDQPAERPVLQRRYTVSAAHHDRGTLLEVELGAPAGARALGGACYRVMAGRSQPCPACPVFDDAAALPARSVIVADDAPGSYQVVQVARAGADALAVESLVLREEVLSELIAAKIARMADRSALTPREREILTLLYLGRSTQEVAEVLDITERTAKYHQANVLRKVGADSRMDLVRLLM